MRLKSTLIAGAMLACTFLALPGCACLPSGDRALKTDLNGLESIPGDTWLRTELYFGMNRPTGEVSEAEWEKFVREEITPRFPEGLTIVGGYGQWQDQSGKIQREGSRMLILLHAPGPSVQERIEQIRRIYCTRFQQESVLRVTFLARVSFYSLTNQLKNDIPRSESFPKR